MEQKVKKKHTFNKKLRWSSFLNIPSINNHKSEHFWGVFQQVCVLISFRCQTGQSFILTAHINISSYNMIFLCRETYLFTFCVDFPCVVKMYPIQNWDRIYSKEYLILLKQFVYLLFRSDAGTAAFTISTLV